MTIRFAPPRPACCRLCRSCRTHPGPGRLGPSAQLTSTGGEQFLCRPGDERPNGSCDCVGRSGPFGKVLVIGSGGYSGCSLYLLTSDQMHSLTGSQFACSDGPNAKGLPCDTVLWPALLTDGAPIAGPGVNPKLLGTVTRTDLPGMGSVQQVTYAGMPLYRFNRDEVPGETEGANVFDPLTSPTGIWYLVEPTRGNPAPGAANIRLETAPIAGTGQNETVLAATMDDDFGPLPNAPFPVYTLGPRRGAGSATARAGSCKALCSQYWPPVLTAGRPIAGTGVGQHVLGTT